MIKNTKYTITIKDNESEKILVNEGVNAIIGAIAFDKNCKELVLTSCSAEELAWCIDVAETAAKDAEEKAPVIVKIMRLIKKENTTKKGESENETEIG